MYVVAVDYAAGAPVEKLQELAQAMGKTAYEMRSRLSLPEGGPAVVGSFAQEDQAMACEAALRGHGFQTLLLSEQEADPAQTELEVRSFGLEDQSLWVEPRQGERVVVSYSDVSLLMRGTSFAVESNTITTTQKKFNLGRAVMTGGLMLNKKVTSSRQVQSRDGEAFLKIYAPGQPGLVFLENSLLYESLGPAMKPSRAANFLYLTTELRRLCPAALYNDRFLRRAGQKQLLGQFLEPEAHLHLATALLVRSLLGSSR